MKKQKLCFCYEFNNLANLKEFNTYLVNIKSIKNRFYPKKWHLLNFSRVSSTISLENHGFRKSLSIYPTHVTLDTSCAPGKVLPHLSGRGLPEFEGFFLLWNRIGENQGILSDKKNLILHFLLHNSEENYPLRMWHKSFPDVTKSSKLLITIQTLPRFKIFLKIPR